MSIAPPRRNPRVGVLHRPKDVATPGTWIVENGSGAGGGGGPESAPAPPVHIDSVEVEEIYDGRFEIRVLWTPDATATVDNFTGVGIYLEDPDLSDTPLAPMDGTGTTMDGSTQAAGKWSPTYMADSTKSPADIRIQGKPAERFIRVYLRSYNARYRAPLHRANEEDPTPNIQATVPAKAPTYADGMEYAWHITNPEVFIVEHFENPEGPKYSLRFSFTEPDDSIPLPPGLLPYGGVQTVYEYPSEGNRRATARFLNARQPETWVSDEYHATTITFLVYFCSAADSNRVNSIVPGVTPMVQVSIVYPPPGKVIVPPVTGFTLTVKPHQWEPDGTIFAVADITWTPPVSNRLGWVEFWHVATNGSKIDPPVELGEAGQKDGKLTLKVLDYPSTVQDWTIAAITVDTNGKLSDDPKNLDTTRPPELLTPTVTWAIGPLGAGTTQGQEYVPTFTIGAIAVTTEQELNNDGVRMMRHKITWANNSTDNSYGGMSIGRQYGADITYWDAAKTATSLITDWEPAPTAREWDFWFVARDKQDRRNSIQPSTPKVHQIFTPQAGNIQISRLPSGWWNEDEFQWPDQAGTGKFTAKEFKAEKIYVGSILRVGGGTGAASASFAGNYNGQIAVYNSSNVIRAWMGEQKNMTTPDNGTPRSVFGGWFGELYVGGSGPPNAPIYCTQGGVVIVGGFEYLTGQQYSPYISIRDNTGTEVGRMGARIARGWSSSLVPQGDPADISGAWFKEMAVGGASLADWRVLARHAPSGAEGQDLFNIRNVNKFTIDYQAEYPNTSNPHNAAMKFEVGADAYVTDVNNPNYFKFPGISMTRTGTSHKMVIINRGFVVHGPDPHTYNGTRMGAFVTYNGSDLGTDAARFWTALLMMSPTDGFANVVLESGGTGHGSAKFDLYDQAQVRNFGVDTVGNVYVRGTLTMTGAFTAASYNVKSGATTYEVISNTRMFTGQGYSGGAVSGAAFTCTSLAAGGGPISGGALTVTGNVGCNTLGVTNQAQAGSFYTTGSLEAGSLKISGSVQFGALSVSSLTSSGTITSQAGISTSGGVGAAGFNPPGYAGATYTVAFRGPNGELLDVVLNGNINMGKVQLKFVGGVFVGTQ